MDIMANKGIRAIPVVENDKLIGIVSVTDVLKAILSLGKTSDDDEE